MPTFSLVVPVKITGEVAGFFELVTSRAPFEEQDIRRAFRDAEEISIAKPITEKTKAGLKIVTADVAFGSWDMREWTEAMVTVK